MALLFKWIKEKFEGMIVTVMPHHQVVLVLLNLKAYLSFMTDFKIGSHQTIRGGIEVQGLLSGNG